MQARHIACPGPTADPRSRLEQYRGEAARRPSTRRGNTRSPGSDNDDVSVGAHGTNCGLSKRRPLIRLASGCFALGRAMAETRRRRRSGLITLSSLIAPPSIRPKYRMAPALWELFSWRFVRAVANVICWAHDREGACHTHELDRERRPRGRGGDGAHRGSAVGRLRPGSRLPAPSCSSIRCTPFTRGGRFAGSAISPRRLSPNMGGARKARLPSAGAEVRTTGCWKLANY